MTSEFANRSATLRGMLFGASALVAGLLVAGPASAEEKALQNGTIGYVLTYQNWALYQAADGSECPQGLNGGPREEYKALFPDDGTKRKLVDTQMKMEIAQFFPEDWKSPLPFREGSGKIAPGLNLDGKVGARDFTSPDGTVGVDNNFFRALGCVANFRGPNGNNFIDTARGARNFAFNRVLLEITGVDSLANDPEVQVTMLRGLQRVRPDAGGTDVMPGGSQPVDTRFSGRFKTVMKGKIVDGVLITEPADDATLPLWENQGGPGEYRIRGMRYELTLTSTGAKGLMAGYNDVESWYKNISRSWMTLIQSYGQFQAPTVYHELHRLADGYPDPKTGANTAISAAMDVRFAQAFIIHKPGALADARPQSGASTMAAGDGARR